MASSWVNAVLQDVAAGCKPVFCTSAQLKEAMVQQFKVVTEVHEVRKELQAVKVRLVELWATSRSSKELQNQLPGMTDRGSIPCFPTWTIAAPTGAMWRG